MIGQILRIRYEITELLQSGSVFSLYRAHDRVNGKDVNIRIIEAPFSGEVAFINQLRGFVQHPWLFSGHGLEKFTDLDDHEGIPFLVSDAPEGRLLSEKIEKLAPYSVPVALGFGHQITEALEFLHQSGIVHGEVTSQTISVSPDGKLCLLQGGIWESYGSSRAAGPAILPSIAPYLAPEVSQGKMPSAQSDIYSVGILMYEMLSGRRPFNGDSAIAIASQHITAEVPNLRGFNSLVPIAVQELILKALSKDPATRYMSAKEMGADLKAMSDAMSFGKQLTWPPRQSSAQPIANEAIEPPQPELPTEVLTEGNAESPETGVEAVVTEPSIHVPEVQPQKPEPDLLFPRTSRPAPVPPDVAEKKKEEELPQPKKQTAAKYVPPSESSRKNNSDEVLVNHRMPSCLGWFTYAFVLALIVMVGGFWFWNASMPKAIKTPSMLGLSFTEAQALAKKSGISVHEVRREFTEKQPVGVVLKSDPRPGDPVRQNSTVGLIVSAGSRFVTIPDLKGVGLDQARKMLSDLDLQVLEPVLYKRDRKVNNGKVISCIPEPRTKAERGTKIRLTVSSSEASDEQMARVRGTYRLKVTIPEGGNDTVFVRIDIVDDMQARTIHEENHKPGDQFTVETDGWGDPVYFKIFYDGELVHQIEKSVKASVKDR